MFVPGRNRYLRLSHRDRAKTQRWLLRHQVERPDLMLALAAANVVHSLCTVTNADTSSASLSVTCVFKI